ncbi:MAG: preprotein translocase subunit SecE [Erysipelotrichaceae bacterium]|nr:preprotein translocase subunit SecE [Erysipelotrichaceae bacterium]
MTGPVKYMKEVVREGKRVRWPKKNKFWSTVAVVVVIALFAALILALEDLAAARIIELLKQAFGG